MWMNEMDVEDALRRYYRHPVAGPAAKTLASLVDAVNGCSDGWPYWQPPKRAAAKLMDLLTQHDTWFRTQYQHPRQGAEASAAELRKAYAQLRRFRTARGDAAGCDFRIFPADEVPGDEPCKPTKIEYRMRGWSAERLADHQGHTIPAHAHIERSEDGTTMIMVLTPADAEPLGGQS